MKEDYKGKSVAELEAILDAAKKGDFSTKPSPKPPIQKSVEESKQIADPIVNYVEEKKSARASSQKRPSALRDQINAQKQSARAGSKNGPRAPIPKAPVKNYHDPNEVQQRKGYGKVPKYLQKFAKEKEEAEAQKAIDAEKAKCPPGTRKMDHDERMEMLE